LAVYVPRAFIAKQAFEDAEREFDLLVERKTTGIVIVEYIHYLIRHQKAEKAFELCHSSLLNRQWHDGELVLQMQCYAQLILKTGRAKFDCKVLEIAVKSKEKDQIANTLVAEVLKTFSTDYKDVLPPVKQIVHTFQISEKVDHREWFIRFQCAVAASAIQEKHLLVKEFAYLN